MKKLTQAEYLPIDKLKSFEGHPFYVKDDDDMEQLTESIRQQGVLNPIMVRPLDTGEYEVISGHRRLHACKKAGIEMIPAFIYSMDRSEAVVAMVDSNLHRKKLLPSEKAFAYKMKMDALKHQGTSSQLGTKQRTDALIAAQTNESRNQIQRYIRLTNLIPGILKLVDEQRMALTPAVEISYLTEEEQYDLFITALFTGMREGEILGLQENCVDLVQGKLIVNKQLQKVRGSRGEYALYPTKNDKSRTIALSNFVLTALRRAHRRKLENKLLHGPAWEDSGVVFTDELGHHLKHQTVYLEFKKIVTEIGAPNARFHDLRHSFAVSSIRAGDDIKTVQEHLGHATAAFTLDVYGHVTDQMHKESAVRMDRFIENVLTG